MLSHAQAFGQSIKESLKKTTQWSAHYFTSKERWYPLAENTLSLHQVTLPKRKEMSSTRLERLNPLQKDEMREWASVNGAVVRQRSCRQETTMARSGTLPENAYHEELRPIDLEHRVASVEDEEMEEEEVEKEEDEDEKEDEEEDEEDEGEAEEWEEEEEELDEEEVLEYSSESEDDDFRVNEMDRAATFLVGSTSRFGRDISINKKYFS